MPRLCQAQWSILWFNQHSRISVFYLHKMSFKAAKGLKDFLANFTFFVSPATADKDSSIVMNLWVKICAHYILYFSKFKNEGSIKQDKALEK